ncbi:V-set and transmembrane domain-containing protein 5 isoform X2 [Erinaceus europaeus]|uniref:V-set and transmembrane domain-containing protein 5 isoform X2 n=1 Tax=Erinaceus europaeus TaxID=9365 RepID=A0ABM3WGE3_ERIEU|nr:V-set and transmembrane domain-containing protein 5 isoform X2 [Erinaceus europaeus]
MRPVQRAPCGLWLGLALCLGAASGGLASCHSPKALPSAKHRPHAQTHHPQSEGLTTGLALTQPQTSPSLTLQATGPALTLYAPQPAINATVAQDVLLSVAYSCPGVPTIEWTHTSTWGARRVAAWQPGAGTNVSRSHQGRVCTFDNGSLQLLHVGVRDTGYYVVMVSERLGGSRLTTITLHVSEVLYEDLHFVAVFLALLATVAALLVSLLWVCDRCTHRLQRSGCKLAGGATEELELQELQC